MSEEMRSILDTLIEDQYVMIGGVRREVRPWSLGKVKRVLPILSAAIALLKKRNALPLKDTSFDQLIEATTKDPSTIIDGLDDFIPLLIGAVAITLDIEESEVEELPIGDGIGLSLLIVKQNANYLKNFFGPQLSAIVKMLSA